MRRGRAPRATACRSASSIFAHSWAKMQIESGHLPYPAGSKSVGIHPLYWTNHAVSRAKMQIESGHRHLKSMFFPPPKPPFTQGSPFGRNRPTRSGNRIARTYIIYNIVYGAQIDRLQFPGISNPLRKLDKMRFVKTTKIRPKRALDRAVCADVTKRGMQKEQEGEKKG